MSTNFNAGSVNASVTSSAAALPSPSVSQTIVMKASGKAGVSITSGTGTLVHTTTSGKTFYVTSIQLGVIGATNPTFDIRDGKTIAGTLVWSGGCLVGGLSGTWLTLSLPSPLKLSTGLLLDTGNGASHTIVYGITGYEA